MAINFPSSPVNNQKYSESGVEYIYDSSIGAWLTYSVSTPFDKSSNTQILFNDSGIANGSNGMSFSKSSNTAYFGNVVVSSNVGIGTTTPSSILDLKGTDCTLRVRDSAQANGIILKQQNSDGGNFLWAINNNYLSIGTNNLERMRILNNGNVAIGRTDAGYKLDVLGTVNASSLLINGSSVLVSLADETSSASTFYPLLTTSTSGSLSSSNVSTTKLYFVPSTGALSATSHVSTSDITLKTDIQGLDNSIEVLSNIRPVSFKWKDNDIKSYGVIAQELEKVLPELVITNDDGVKSVSYIPLIAFLVDAVKTQQEKINNMEETLNRIINKEI